jgi:hypothetical protein
MKLSTLHADYVHNFVECSLTDLVYSSYENTIVCVVNINAYCTSFTHRGMPDNKCIFLRLLGRNCSKIAASKGLLHEKKIKKITTR